MMRGIGRLAARIERMPANVRAGVAELLAMAAEEAAREARRLAPVDTGALRESISAELISPDEAAVIAGAPHAAYVEFGTSEAAAQPFLTPAAAHGRDVLRRRARQVLSKGGRI